MASFTFMAKRGGRDEDTDDQEDNEEEEDEKEEDEEKDDAEGTINLC